MPFSAPVAERLAGLYAKHYAPGRAPSPKIDALFSEVVAKRDPALMSRLRQQGTEARIAERSPGVALEAPHLATEAPEAQEARSSNRYTEALKEFGHDPLGHDAENPATFFRAAPDDTAAETVGGRALDLIPGVSSYVASDLETPETAPQETTLGDDIYGVAKGLTHFVPIAAGLTPVLGPAGAAAVASGAVGGVPTGTTMEDAKEAGHMAIDAATAGVLSKVLKGVRASSVQEIAKKAGFEGTDEAIAELNRRAGKEVFKDAAEAAEKIDPTYVAKALAGKDAPPAIKAFGSVLADRASTIKDTIEATRDASRAALEALSTTAKKSAGKAVAKNFAADVVAGLAQTTGVAAVEGRAPTAFELGVGGALPAAVHGADALALRKAGGVGEGLVMQPTKAEAHAAKEKADADAEVAAAEAEKLSEAQGALAPFAKRGDSSRVLIAGEERKPTKVTYVAVPLEKIVPSHDPVSFEKNPAHGIGNTRDYGGSQSLKLGVMQDAQNLDPGILLSTGEYNQDGPPVVDSSGSVLGGNGRTMKMMRAMKQYPEKWKAYVAELRKRAGEFGLKPEDIGENDVLVRMVPHETANGRKEALVQKFNEPASNAPTLAEEAQGYANLLSDDDVAAIKVNDGETFRQAIARHGEEWLGQWAKSNKIPRTQIGRLIDPTTGKLSADGKRLLENVVLGKLVGDKATFDLVADDAPLRDALSRAAGPLIELANLETQGRIKGGGVLKALPKVLKWVTTAAEGKVKGGQQGDIAAPTFTKREQTLVDLFVNARENPKAFGDAIRDTVAEIRGKAPKAKDEQDLLAGDQPTLPDAGAYLDALSRRFKPTPEPATPAAPEPQLEVSRETQAEIPPPEAPPDAPLETAAADAVPADVPPEVPVAASPEVGTPPDAGSDTGVVPEPVVAVAEAPVAPEPDLFGDSGEEQGGSEGYTRALEITIKGKQAGEALDDLAAADENARAASELDARVERNAQRQPYVPQAERFDAARGKEAIINRLRLEVSKEISEAKKAGRPLDEARLADEVKAVEKFIDLFDRELIDDVALSIRTKGPKSASMQGVYNFASSIVTIFKNNTAKSGDFGRTAIHEIWHALSRVLPEEHFDAVIRQYRKERDAYIAKNKWFAWFTERDSLSPNEYELFQQENPGKSLTKGDDGRYRVEYDADNYRYKNVDEWFAETLSDRSQKRMAQLDENAKSLLLHTRNVVLNMYEAVRQALGLDVAGKMFEKYVRGEFTPRDLYEHAQMTRHEPIEPHQLFDREKEIMRTWREQRIGEAKGEDIFQADVRSTIDDLDKSLRDVSGRGLPEAARTAAEARAKEYAETDRHVRDFIDKHGADAFAERGAEAIQRTVDDAVAAGEAPKALSAAVAAMVRRNPERYARLALAFVDPTVARRGAYAEKQNLIILAAKATARGGLRAGVEELYHGIAKTLSGSDRATVLAQHTKAVGERLVEVRKMQQDLMRAGATAEQVRELGAEARWLEDAIEGKANPGDAPDGWYHLSDPDEFFANTLTDIELQRNGASYLADDHGALRMAAAKAKQFLQDFWESMKGIVGAEDKMLALWKRLEDPAHTVADGGRMLRHEAWLRTPENFERWLATVDEGDVAQARPPRAPTDKDTEDVLARVFPSMKPEAEVPIRQRISDWWKDFKANAGFRVIRDLFDQYHVAAESKKKFGRGANVSAIDALRKTRHAGQLMDIFMRFGHVEWDSANGIGKIRAQTEGLDKTFTKMEGEGLFDLTFAFMAGERARAYESEGRPTGIATADAAKLSEIVQKYPQVQQYAETIQAAMESVLDFAEANGVVGKAGRAMWGKGDAQNDLFALSREEIRNAFYVPFFRVIEAADNPLEVIGPMEKGGVFDQVSGIKRLKGSESPIGDPFENWTKMVWHLYDASLKNNAARKVIGELQAIQAITGEPMVRRLKEKQHGTNAVAVLEDGFRHYYDILDPEWYRAVRTMGPKKYGMVMRAMIGARHILSGAVTKSPGFLIVNPIRDSLSVAINSKVQPWQPATNYIRAFRNDPAKLKLLASGAASGGFYASSPNAYSKNLRASMRPKSAVGKLINSPIALFRFLERLGEATETGTRIAAWEDIKKRGGTDAEAAAGALDVINYGMQGGSEWLGTFLDTVPFLRARLAGGYKLGRSATDASTRATFWQRGAMLSAATLALAYLNKKYNAEQYDALEDFDKDANWHVFLGDTHVRIPKPFEAGLFFGTAVERSMGPFGFLDPSSPDAGDWDLAADRMMSALSQTFEVNPVPQLLVPYVEQIANKSGFTGRPIVPLHQQNLEPGLQYDDRTSNTAIAAAKLLPDLSAIGMEGSKSPARIEALVRGYFGSMAAYVLSMSDTMMTPWQELRPGHRSPIDLAVGRLVETTSDARATRYIGQFYDLANEARKAQLTLQTYAKKRDFEAARAYAEENAPILSLADSIGDVEKALGSLQQGMAAVRVDESLSREEREARISELGGQRNMIARDFTRKLREIQAQREATTDGAR